MPRTAKLILLILTGISISTLAVAQDVTQADLPEANAFVDVYFKQKEAFIDDIQIDEIEIKKQKGIRAVSVRDIGESPLDIAILVDTSGSQVENINEIRQLCALMILLLPLQPIDSLSILTFNDELEVTHYETVDRTLLLKRFKDILFIGGTSLYDAIYYGNGTLNNHPGCRRIMIIISDGVDRDSIYKIEAAYQEAIANNVRVYMFVTEHKSRSNSLFYQYFQENKSYKKHDKHIKKTGGKIFVYSDLKSAEEQVIQMLDELNHLKRIGLSVDSTVKKTSGFKVTVSRKGVKAYYPDDLQKTSDESSNDEKSQ